MFYGAVYNQGSGRNFGGDNAFVLVSPTPPRTIDHDATGAAGLEAGVEHTIAGMFGLSISSDEIEPLVLAYDIPNGTTQVTLQALGSKIPVSFATVAQLNEDPPSVKTMLSSVPIVEQKSGVQQLSETVIGLFCCVVILMGLGGVGSAVKSVTPRRVDAAASAATSSPHLHNGGPRQYSGIYNRETPLQQSASQYSYPASTISAPNRVTVVSGSPSSIPPLPVSPQPAGVVYLLKAGPFYKIGKTSNFEKRLGQIRLQLPYTVEVIHKIITPQISEVESYWHKRFKSKRTNGEWFLLTDEDVEQFKSHFQA